MDCGNTWSAPIKVSRPEDTINQGSSLTIDPRTGAVYVSWRRFDPDLADTNDLDAIMVARLPLGATRVDAPGRAHKFPKPTRKVGQREPAVPWIAGRRRQLRRPRHRDTGAGRWSYNKAGNGTALVDIRVGGALGGDHPRQRQNGHRERHAKSRLHAFRQITSGVC
jgi:hypothetical protein